MRRRWLFLINGCEMMQKKSNFYPARNGFEGHGCFSLLVFSLPIFAHKILVFGISPRLVFRVTSANLLINSCPICRIMGLDPIDRSAIRTRDDSQMGSCIATCICVHIQQHLWLGRLAAPTSQIAAWNTRFVIVYRVAKKAPKLNSKSPCYTLSLVCENEKSASRLQIALQMILLGETQERRRGA